MTTEERLSTRDAAEYVGLSKQRIGVKIQAGHYQGVSRCECKQTVMIPVSELNRDMVAGTIKRRRKK